MASYLWVALGSALGGMARFWGSAWAAERLGDDFPWGTIGINILGSFIIGFFATLTGPDGRLLVAPGVRQLVMIGFCGGFTTFSSFSLQTLTLVQGGDWIRAGWNVLLTVFLCLLFVGGGHIAAAALNQIKGA